ncbi:guanine nucleotide exchange protein for ADP-robosylation factor [Mycoemilia scoparia]|uniref:Guanine nucleotide exchange protein for ADP-robosylation factor n=1 Tax=Mycoemilia scoparia TaxID=417184 RepID=A0A9W7ZZ46_9FUNG|nr:guanine nucleotide exchange protein for ADP-robosylation factor [Mycoemilia scoparia]
MSEVLSAVGNANGHESIDLERKSQDSIQMSSSAHSRSSSEDEDNGANGADSKVSFSSTEHNKITTATTQHFPPPATATSSYEDEEDSYYSEASMQQHSDDGSGRKKQSSDHSDLDQESTPNTSNQPAHSQGASDINDPAVQSDGSHNSLNSAPLPPPLELESTDQNGGGGGDKNEQKPASTHPNTPLPSLVMVIGTFEKLMDTWDGRRKSMKLILTETVDTLKKKADSANSVANNEFGDQSYHTSSRLTRSEADTVLKALEMSCETQSQACMVLALDCIEKIVSYHYLDPLVVPMLQPPQPSTAKSIDTPEYTEFQKQLKDDYIFGQTLGSRIVTMICNCLRSKSTPEAVQLQIVKALLTTVSMSSLPVHLGTLQYAVRTMYNVYLLCKNPGTQTIAQGALAQIIHLVFSRVPLGYTQLQESNDAESGMTYNKDTVDDASSMYSPQPPDSAITNAEFKTKEHDKAADGLMVDSSLNNIYIRDAFLVFRSLCKISMKNGEKENIGDMNSIPMRARALALHLIDMVLTGHMDVFTTSLVYLRMSSSGGGGGGSGENKCDPKSTENTKSGPVSSPQQGQNSHYLSSVSEELKQTYPVGLGSGPSRKDDIDNVNEEEEMASNARATIKASQAASEAVQKSHDSINIGENKNAASTTNSTDDIKPATYIGDSGKSNQSDSVVAVPFIAVIKQYLSLSLSQNLVSGTKTILSAALSIFEKTVLCLRHYFKHECELIFKEIILPMLEMKYATTPMQRDLLIASLAKVLSDPQLVVELYLNYDCDSDASVNVFERLVEVLAKISGSIVTYSGSRKSSSSTYTNSYYSEYHGFVSDSEAWNHIRSKQTVFSTSADNTYFAQQQQQQQLQRKLSLHQPVASTETIPQDRLSKRESVSTQTPQIDRPSVSSTNNLPYIGGLDKNLTLQAAQAQASGAKIDDYLIRQHCLDALTALLQSMVVWSDRPTNKPLHDTTATAVAASSLGANPQESREISVETSNTNNRDESVADDNSTITATTSATFGKDDDPEQLQNIKRRKEKFTEALKLFNHKPKKGVKRWIDDEFILSSDPKDIARFLLTNTTAGINKAQLGEYLGEGDAENIAVMHAFVDLMDFTNQRFVSALRQFLQAFRLPGESQKIDRFMLKFAERYVMGNPDVFANADAAYVLAYSVIMLNTDLHSAQVKRRMTKDQFIANNRGINDNSDLPEQMLVAIYDEIGRDEIILKDDPLGETVKKSQDSSYGFMQRSSGLGGGRRVEPIVYYEASQTMAQKAEESLRRIARNRKIRRVSQLRSDHHYQYHGKTSESSSRGHGGSDSPIASAASATFDEQADARTSRESTRSGTDGEDERANLMSDSMVASTNTLSVLLDVADFTRASRAEHVAPMFKAIWAPVLAALSSPMQTSHDPFVISTCLLGFQCGIAISCRFRMNVERSAYVTTLANFTSLANLAEIRHKNIEAIHSFLEVAASRPDIGDGLGDHWLDILKCVSQLERLQQLIQVPMYETAHHYQGNGGNGGPDTGPLAIPATVLLSTNPRASMSLRRTSMQSSSSSAVTGLFGFGGGSSNASKYPQIPKVLVSDLASLGVSSQALVVAVDRIFTSSVSLSGAGIVNFVRALSQVSWDEIESSTGHYNASHGRKPSNATVSSQTSSNMGGGDASVASVVSSNKPGRSNQLHHQATTATANTTSPPPRMYSLQKIVEISYYNMGRIRVEWAQVWAILGEHFNRAGSHPDPRVVAFTLDSLRQLSMKFLEKEELPHFQFQKDFLRPFSYVLETSALGTIGSGVKDMVLQCVLQIVRSAAHNIRSGWKAIFYVAQAAARDPEEAINEQGFRLAKECANNHTKQMWYWSVQESLQQSAKGGSATNAAVLDTPIDCGKKSESVDTVTPIMVGSEYFNEMIDCLNEYVMNSDLRPRIALQALHVMRDIVSKVAKDVESLLPQSYGGKVTKENCETACASPTEYDVYFQLFTPLFKAMHEVVMRANDLEVRTGALDTLFSFMKEYGKYFSATSWESLLTTRVFSIFEDLQYPHNSHRFTTVDDLELWFSTTLIKALRHVIELFTLYFEHHLERYFSNVLQLLKLCIVQPSKTLIEIGVICLQELVESNYSRFDEESWNHLCALVVDLFQWSQPNTLLRPTATRTNQPENSSNKEEVDDDDDDVPLISRKQNGRNSLFVSPHRGLVSNGVFGETTASRMDGGPNAGSGSNSYNRIKLKCLLQLQLIKLLDQLLTLPHSCIENSRSPLIPTSTPEPSSTPTGNSNTTTLPVNPLVGYNYTSIPKSRITLDPLTSTSGTHDIAPHISSHHLLCLLDCLEQSRDFAHRFNCNIPLRQKLVEVGIVPQMPSLLKQETSSALASLRILGRMYLEALREQDDNETNKNLKESVSQKNLSSKWKFLESHSHKDRKVVQEEIEDKFVSLMLMVLTSFNGISPDDRLGRPTSPQSGDADAGAEFQDDERNNKHNVTTLSWLSDKHTGRGTKTKETTISEHDLLLHPKYRKEWRKCVYMVLSFLPHLAIIPVVNSTATATTNSKKQKAKVDEIKELFRSHPFVSAMSKLYPQLIRTIGAAAENEDFELISWCQVILAAIGQIHGICPDTIKFA